MVQLPSKQYSLELSNETVGSLVSEKSRVIGRQYGHTELRLLDKNTPIDHNVSTDIYVVKPHHIGIYIYICSQATPYRCIDFSKIVEDLFYVFYLCMYLTLL